MVEQFYFGSVEIEIDYTNGDDYLTVPSVMAKRLGIEARDEILIGGLGWIYVAKICPVKGGRDKMTLFTAKRLSSGSRSMLRIRGYDPDETKGLESLGVDEHA